MPHLCCSSFLIPGRFTDTIMMYLEAYTCSCFASLYNWYMTNGKKTSCSKRSLSLKRVCQSSSCQHGLDVSLCTKSNQVYSFRKLFIIINGLDVINSSRKNILNVDYIAITFHLVDRVCWKEILNDWYKKISVWFPSDLFLISAR